MPAHAKNTVKKALFVPGPIVRRRASRARRRRRRSSRHVKKKCRCNLVLIRRGRACAHRGEGFAQTLRTRQSHCRLPADRDRDLCSPLRRVVRTSRMDAGRRPPRSALPRPMPGGMPALAHRIDKATERRHAADVAVAGNGNGNGRTRRPFPFTRGDRISGRRSPAVRRSRPDPAVHSPAPARTSRPRTASLRRRRPR